MIGAFAKALEVIPRQICDNAGIDATDVLNKLRMLHGRGEIWAGVDVEGEGVGDNMKNFVFEPSVVKINALEGAAEAACLVLSVDETVTNPQSAAVRLSFSFSLYFNFSLTFRLFSADSNNLVLRRRELLSRQCEEEVVGARDGSSGREGK